MWLQRKFFSLSVHLKIMKLNIAVGNRRSMNSKRFQLPPIPPLPLNILSWFVEQGWSREKCGFSLPVLPSSPFPDWKRSVGRHREREREQNAWNRHWADESEWYVLLCSQPSLFASPFLDQIQVGEAGCRRIFCPLGERLQREDDIVRPLLLLHTHMCAHACMQAYTHVHTHAFAHND